MPEPARPLVRPMVMKPSVLLLGVLASVVLAGCGSSAAPRSHGSAAEAGATSTIGSCATDAPGVTKATDLAKVDLDGDGTPDQVKVTSPEGSCPNVVFAELGSGYVAGQVPTDGPPVRAAFGVRLPGRDGDLLVTQQAHPRGGYQLRAFARGSDGLTELTYQGKTPFPFVATDVQQPIAVDCAGEKVVITQALPHEPHGVMFAWDVQRSTYQVQGESLSRAADQELADNVLPAQLTRKYPELAGHTLFKSCRT